MSVGTGSMMVPGTSKTQTEYPPELGYITTTLEIESKKTGGKIFKKKKTITSLGDFNKAKTSTIASVFTADKSRRLRSEESEGSSEALKDLRISTR